MGELRRLCFPPQIIESCSKCSDLAMMAARAFSAMELNSLVLLIDEYDSPLNLNLQNKTVFEGIRYKIRGFYAAIKANEGNLRFVFVTGVSRFNKVALFSAGSSIQDLSLNPLYGSLLGYTEDEIRHYFGEHLRAARLNRLWMSSEGITTGTVSTRRRQHMFTSPGQYCSFCRLMAIMSSLTTGFRTAGSAPYSTILSDSLAE